MSSHKQSSAPAAIDQWPGGRTRLVRGRHLPRRLTKLCKEQQVILESDHGWQPSISDRQIRGSIPTKLLNYFQELADRASKGASNDTKLDASVSSPSAPIEKAPRSGLDSNSSQSEESVGEEWDSTPERLAAARPALPENSSPLHAPQRALNQPYLPLKSPDIEMDRLHTQLKGSEVGLPIPSPGAPALSDEEQFEEAFSKGAAAGDVCERDFWDDKRHGLLSGQEQARTISKSTHLQPARRESGQENEPRTSHSALKAPHIENKRLDHNNHRKAFIQVHRTPFGHQPSALEKPAGVSGQAVDSQEKPPKASHSDQEPGSSASIIPGTFRNMKGGGPVPAKVSKLPQNGEHSSLYSDKPTMRKRGGVSVASASFITTNVASEIPRSRSQDDSSARQQYPTEPRGAKRKSITNNEPLDRSQSSRPLAPHPLSSTPAESKRLRIASACSSVRSSRGQGRGKSASEIARESRRAFFHNQTTAVQNSSSFAISTPSPEEVQWSQRLLGPKSNSRASHHAPKKSGLATPTTCSRCCISFEQGSECGPGSRTSSDRLNLYTSYRTAYPEYQGDVLSFQKACKHIQLLDKEGRAPHPSLWDDFIFRRHHQYRQYLFQVAEACEDALPYLQYYTRYIEKPARIQLVVRPSHLMSCVSVDPALAKPKDFINYSSAPSHLALTRPACAASEAPGVSEKIQLLPRPDETHPTKASASSVKQWVEEQSLRRSLGAESPELGTNVEATVEQVRECVGDQFEQNTAEMPASSSNEHESTAETMVEEFQDKVEDQLAANAAEIPSFSPPKSGIVEGKQDKTWRWYEDYDTPFKNFVRSFATLAEEQRQSKEVVQFGANGALKPHLATMIDIFSRYRR